MNAEAGAEAVWEKNDGNCAEVADDEDTEDSALPAHVVVGSDGDRGAYRVYGMDLLDDADRMCNKDTVNYMDIMDAAVSVNDFQLPIFWAMKIKRTLWRVPSIRKDLIMWIS